MIAQFHFLRPLWLLAIPVALLLTVALWRLRSSGANWRRAIAPELLDHLLDRHRERRLHWPWWLAGAGWMVGALALAGPTWEKLPQPVLQNRDALVVVLDLSLSMNAADIQPTRLQRARFKLLDLLEQRREGLTGLVVYSGDAHIVTPLTDDTATIANLVPSLAPDMMPVYGSDVGGAMQQAVQLLHSSGIARGRILLLTDDIENADIETVAAQIRKTPHALSILGVGTAQGAPIPVQGGFLKNADGSIAIPQLHRERLQQLAAGSGGRYRDIQPDDADLRYLVPSAVPDDNALRVTEREFDQWRERGPWLALALLPLAALAFRRGWLVALLAVLLALPPEPALAADNDWQQRGAQWWRDLWATPDQQAAARLDAGDAKGAADQFADPAWRASAKYRAGDYEQAAQGFQTLRDASGAIPADADYNRGNALARSGQLQDALAAYDDALRKNPQLEDAKANRALVENLLRQQQRSEGNGDASGQDPSQSEPMDSSASQSSAGRDQAGQPSTPSSPPSNDPRGDQGTAQKQPAQPSGQRPDTADSQTAQSDASQTDSGDKRDAQQMQSGSASKPDDASESQSQTEAGNAATAQDSQLTPEQQRQQQVMEQWLRQIPDDPAGLLRRKFDYEFRQRGQPPAQSGGKIY